LNNDPVKKGGGYKHFCSLFYLNIRKKSGKLNCR